MVQTSNDSSASRPGSMMVNRQAWRDCLRSVDEETLGVGPEERRIPLRGVSDESHAHCREL